MDFSHWKFFKQWLKETKKNRGRSSAFYNDSNPNWGKCGIWKWFSLFIDVKMHWFTTYVVDIVSIFFFSMYEQVDTDYDFIHWNQREHAGERSIALRIHCSKILWCHAFRSNRLSLHSFVRNKKRIQCESVTIILYTQKAMRMREIIKKHKNLSLIPIFRCVLLLPHSKPQTQM